MFIMADHKVLNDVYNSLLSGVSDTLLHPHYDITVVPQSDVAKIILSNADKGLVNDKGEDDAPKIKIYKDTVARIKEKIGRASAKKKVEIIDYISEHTQNHHNVIVQPGIGTTIYFANCTMSCLVNVEKMLMAP